MLSSAQELPKVQRTSRKSSQRGPWTLQAEPSFLLGQTLQSTGIMCEHVQGTEQFDLGSCKSFIMRKLDALRKALSVGAGLSAGGRRRVRGSGWHDPFSVEFPSAAKWQQAGQSGGLHVMALGRAGASWTEGWSLATRQTGVLWAFLRYRR